MSKQGKLWALLFLTMAVLAMLALASGLSGVEPRSDRNPALLDGRPDAVADDDQEGSPALSALSPEATRIALWSLAAAGLLGFGYVLWRIRNLPPPDQQSSLIRSFIFVLAAIVIALNIDRLGLNFNLDQSAAPGGAAVPALTPTAALSVAIGMVLLSLLFLAGYVVWRRMRPLTPLDQLAREAEETLEALQSGEDLRHAIIHCYARMCDVLRQEKRIERQEAMTAREFAAGLAAHGIAGAEVSRLTRLFETVRYGGALGQALGPREEAEAVSCLQTIAAAARRKQGRRRAAPAGGGAAPHHTG